jgi:putative DNA primase/helicase
MAKFYDRLLNGTTGDVHLWALPNTKGDGPERWIGTRNENRIEAFVKKRDIQGYGTFFCVSTIAPNSPRKKEFALETPWLFCDTDFKNIDLPPEQIEQILRDLECPPSIMHHTGNGIHNFWLFDSPVQLAEFRDRLEIMLRKLAAYLGSDPLVAHVVALLRVPASHNSKRGEWKEVRVIKEGREVYTLDQLEEWLGATTEPVMVTRGKVQENDPFTQAGANQSFPPPIDVEQRLADMVVGGDGDQGVHSTQLSCTASLMAAGVDIDEAVAFVLDATKELAGTDGWDWVQEQRTIEGMCTDWVKKQNKPDAKKSKVRDASIAPVRLADALRTRKDKRESLILDPLDPMRSAREMYKSEYVTPDGYRTLVRHRGEFFQWDGACYQINAEEAQRGEIWRHLENAKIIAKDGKLAAFKPKKDNVGNVHEALSAICAVNDYIEPPAWIGDEPPIAPPNEFFAASNGLLHLPTRMLHDPTPSFFGVTASGVAYDPDAAAPMQWLAYLRETVDDDEGIGALQEWMGYTLGGDTSQQKILFCIGPRRSGKGTFARIHTALLGKNSVGGPTMSAFGKQFGLAPLITKSLAIVSDARIGKKTDRAEITERLLTISGEDTIDIDRKYGTMWTGRLPTRIAIMTNELPAFSEGSGALAGRFLIVIFPHSFFGRENPGLTDRLMTELPGILNWAIQGYERLRARGHFLQPTNALEQIEAIERLGNPVKAFVLDRCVVGPAREIDADVLYDDWRTWCSDHGGDAGNKDWFGRNLRSAVPGLTTARHGSADADGRRRTVYRGVGIETPNQPRSPGYRLTEGARRSGAR